MVWLLADSTILHIRAVEQDLDGMPQFLRPIPASPMLPAQPRGTPMKRIAAVLAGCAAVATYALASTQPVPLKTTEFGRGPTIVLLHGMGSARTIWLPTAKKLL